MSAASLRKLADDVGSFATDPFGYAHYAWPWGEVGTPLEGINGPRRWQSEVLREIGDHLSNPETRFRPLRMAVASGHGVGKSSLIAMIAAWALDTCPDTRIIVTANTEGQLANKTSPELTKWRQLAITKDWFKTSVLSIASSDKRHAHSWRLDCVPWSVHQPEAFAGLHNAGRRIVFLFDESAAIDDRIYEVSEGALTDSGTELLWIVCGNPTRGSGRFRECFGKYRHLWSCRHLDSRTVEGTDKRYLDDLVATYGEDSDFVKVRVRGQFPSQSSLQFIGSDIVDAARARLLPTSDLLPSDPVIFGLDHARFGADETVLAIRQGRDARSRPWQTWSGASSIDIAGGVLEAANRYMPDAIFIDAGGPNAGGIIDQLRMLMGDKADRVFEINFGSAMKGMEAIDISGQRTRVANRRAQMWTRLRGWLERGIIPDHQQLADDLTVLEYGYNLDNAIQLERKEHLRARGCASPDRGDALALTFAEDVMPREVPEYLNPWNYHKQPKAFDRYAELGSDKPVAREYDRYRDF